MKNYELLAIFKPSLDSEELDKVVEKISDEIKSYKGSVASVDKMGRQGWFLYNHGSLYTGCKCCRFQKKS